MPGQRSLERASFKVVAEAFPSSILLGLSVFRYTCNSPPPVLHSLATLILQRTCLLPLFRETTVIDCHAPFSLTLVQLLLIHAASTAGRSCTAPPQFIIVRLLRKARLLFLQFGLSILYFTNAKINLSK